MRTPSALFPGLILGVVALAAAQSVPLPNPSFETGVERPDGWTLSGGGKWINEGAADGTRAIVASGNGKDTSEWRCAPVEMLPGRIYRLAFMARRLSGTGSAISGPACCNRDITSEITPQWKRIESIFITPAQPKPDRSIHFGQWHMNGSVAFDAVDLCQAQAIHSRLGDMELGEGEKLSNDQYVFEAPFRSASRNYSRPLREFTCGFNTDRWVFSAGTYVTYEHHLWNQTPRAAKVNVSITYHIAGRLIVEARSGASGPWQTIGTLDKLGSGAFTVPAGVLEDAWVRLRGEPIDKGAVNFQVGRYGYEAQLAEPPAGSSITGTFAGSTKFFAIQSVDPALDVSIHSIGEALPGGRNLLIAEIRKAAKSVAANLQVQPADGAPLRFAKTFPLDPSMPGRVSVRLPYEIPWTGASLLTFTLGDGSPFKGTLSIQVPDLHNASYGQRLPGSTDGLGLWWCSSGWKVSRTRPLPDPAARSEALSIRLAANECEAAQLILRPAKDTPLFSARATDLKSESGKLLPASAVEILRVRYVNVAYPTDSTGCVGQWPDPLPPFPPPRQGSYPGVAMAANTNQPLWVRVRAPKDAAPGLYTGKVEIRGLDLSVDVPVAVEVYGFALPDRLTCVSAFGFSASEMFRYQGLTDPADRRAVLEKYWASFAAHHISPYDPAPLDPIKISWPAKNAKLEEMKPAFDFSRWDPAMTRAMDEYHFNSFRLNLHGMGGGTFHHRVDPELQGFAENTPQYKALMSSYLRGLESHLKEKGWLDRAYIYWFDEPDKKDYAFVTNGFNKLKEYAPGLNRMLTEQVEPELCGGPNIWCPVTPSYNHEKAQQRRREGEKFWWYVCCGPKAPWCTLFIDHPATELRVWLWQTWQRKIDGILVWQANYWTSPTAYPDKDRPQNPYDDPMGWVSGYGTPTGEKRQWGNGDGRFLYPPEAAAGGRPAKPVLEGPVDSIRWEMLRDGLEDYEYLVILRALLAEKSGKLPPPDRDRFEKLLEVPEQITRDMTTFTSDPAPIESRRDTIARAIEELKARK